MRHKAKPVWDVLISKADMELRGAKNMFDAVSTRKNKAELRHTKLNELLVEYRGRLNNILSRAHNPPEAGHYRQFIVQLEALKLNSSEDLQRIRQDHDDVQKNLIAADQGKLKLVRLGHRARNRLLSQRSKYETKELEAQSIVQFNLNSRPNS